MGRASFFLLSLILLGSSFSVRSADGSDTLRYRPPLDIPLRLSGNFGELRPGHFHTGLDMKTYGRTGLEVKSVEKGFVSRIKVQEGGYGRALYIDHPDGRTSVYAHLESFSPEIREFLREVQYKQERNPIDLYPRKGLLEVEKGETVARSGNSGHSQAPHLHFEIRDTESEKPMDPMLFGFDVRDQRAPSFHGLRIVKQSNGEGYYDPQEGTYSVQKLGGNLHGLSQGGTVELSGPIGFAVRVRDRVSTSYNPLGVQKIRVSIDDEPFFSFRFDTLDFNKKGYFNAHIDHPYLYHHGRRYHRCHLLPHNELPIYDRSKGRGWFTPKPDSTYRVRIEAFDRAGNRSVLRFRIKGVMPPVITGTSPDPDRISWKEGARIEKEGFALNSPPKATYNDLNLEYKVGSDRRSGSLSKTHQVHSPATPLHKAFEARIKLDSLPPGAEDKLFIASKDDRWGRSLYKASYRDGWAIGELDRFGDLSVRVDSVAPEIDPLRVSETLARDREAHFRIRVDEDFSWVDHYEARVDGKWRICYRDVKTGVVRVLVNEPDDPLSKGTHRLTFKVRDAAGNERVLRERFQVE